VVEKTRVGGKEERKNRKSFLHAGTNKRNPGGQNPRLRKRYGKRENSKHPALVK